MKFIIDGNLVDSEMITHIEKDDYTLRIFIIGPHILKIQRISFSPNYTAPWNDCLRNRDEKTMSAEELIVYKRDCDKYNTESDSLRKKCKDAIDGMYWKILEIWNPLSNKFTDITINI